MNVSLDALRGSLTTWALVVLGAVLFVWIAFFDSHSLLRRYTWQSEMNRLTQENQRLRMQIDELERELAKPLSDETVERIAREEYGMKRPGEVVYRLPPSTAPE